MYESADIICDIVEKANDVVLNEHLSKFDSLFTALEKYCETNNILIGGDVGIDLITGVKKSRHSYLYELYTDNAFDHATSFERRLKDAEFTFGENVGDFDQFHSEAKVGFIRPVFIHDFKV